MFLYLFNIVFLIAIAAKVLGTDVTLLLIAGVLFIRGIIKLSGIEDEFFEDSDE